MAERQAPEHDATERSSWVEVHRALSTTAPGALDASDLERLAVADYLTGRDDDSAVAWEAAHRRHLESGDIAEAARCSFWLALCLLLRGHGARASGWLRRTEDLLDDAHRDCRAAGYLLIPQFLGALDTDPERAQQLAERVTEFGERFHDPDLRAFGVLAHGQALIALGDTVSGTARLDDVMVSVTAGEVGPITTGVVYCAVILECVRMFDVARACEWTEALSTWCERQPELVPYRGQCLVHRAQLQQARGEWTEAVVTAEAACQWLHDPPHPALGAAYYQAAELQRLCGALDDADTSYREAHRHGHSPVPGLALLELARGDAAAAEATIRRALAETAQPLDDAPPDRIALSPADRPALLAAAVDIFSERGDLASARAAADELAVHAAGSKPEMLRALAAQALGTVACAEGDPSAALAHLRAAAASWRALNMPYERARVAVRIGVACAALGDHASAAMEFESAQETFVALGARPDIDHLAQLAAPGAAPAAARPDVDRGHRLSAREREVLAQVAAGKTNREIARDLTISQHTVGRHLENVFAKLGVTNRAAAIAYAYEHQLL
jgi:DNA-binding CsgD family transcriptional regulator/tetratricopeptide (TPR) repeat protein